MAKLRVAMAPDLAPALALGAPWRNDISWCSVPRLAAGALVPPNVKLGANLGSATRPLQGKE
jgi:hypothetical protein